MPNGHESIPRWASPLVLLVATVVSVFWYARGGKIVWALASCALAVLFSWRFSFHVTMWDATEYGGAYTTEAEMTSARKRYRSCAIATTVVALSAVTMCLLLLRR
jgi:hypothetical protein